MLLEGNSRSEHSPAARRSRKTGPGIALRAGLDRGRQPYRIQETIRCPARLVPRPAGTRRFIANLAVFGRTSSACLRCPVVAQHVHSGAPPSQGYSVSCVSLSFGRLQRHLGGASRVEVHEQFLIFLRKCSRGPTPEPRDVAGQQATPNHADRACWPRDSSGFG